MTSVTTIPTPATVDMPRVARFVALLNQLRAELKEIFMERDVLIDQIIYALLTRENVLVFGNYGTGKTDLTTTLFERFVGSTIFNIELNKFMSEGHVVGMPNIKKIREEGTVEYTTDGGILSAHFVELDEIFDANAPLLRVLLGVLNERHFKRGRQFEKANLLTAIGCTNGDPAAQVRRSPELAAVIDRFLFQSEVKYLDDAQNRLRMYAKYLHGQKPSVEIDLAELLYVSGVVTGANQVTQMYPIEVFDQVLTAFKKDFPSIIVSDRRACKLIKLMEASALLFGRYEVDIEDVTAIKYGLCMGGSQNQFEGFQRIVDPIIEQANQARAQSIDEVQLRLLERLQSQAPVVIDGLDDAGLVRLRRELRAYRREVEDVKPQLSTTQAIQRQIISDIDSKITNVDEKLN